MPPADSTASNYITLREASRRIGLGVASVRNLVRDGHLSAYHLRSSSGGSTLVREDDVAALIEPGRPGKHTNLPDVRQALAAQKGAADVTALA